MIPTAYPEATRLVYRIRAALTGESTGFETAKLAWQQAEAVARANADLARAAEALQQDALLDCLLIEAEHPLLLETAATLQHPLADAWKQRCATYAWRAPEPVDVESASEIQAAIQEVSDLKDWLYTHYRAAVRSKDSTQAYRTIRLIAARFPDDPNATQEAESRQSQLFEQATQEIKDALEQLIPKEDPKSIARRYLSLGLPLADETDPAITPTLQAIQAERLSRFAEEMQTVVTSAETLHDNGNWQETEKAYLACDYAIAINDARGDVDPGLRAAFENVATQLSRIRAKYESHISLRGAIGELRHGSRAKGKPVSMAHRVEKLRSLETQSLKTGNQIPPDLQKELKDAYAYSRNKRLPLLAGVAAAAIAGLAIVFWLVQQQNEREAQAELRRNALLALQQSERAGSVGGAQAALEEWSPAINAAEPSSSLSSQAEILQEWIASQAALNSDYADTVGQLERALQSNDSLARGEEIAALIAQARKTRSDLAPDMGTAFDTRFDEAVQSWTQRVQQAEQSRLETLARLQRELTTATRSANQAKSREEFERLRDAAEIRIQNLNTLLAEDPQSSARAQLQSLVESASQSLSSLETKWAALEAARQQLQEAETLDDYLTQLERIHSFDTLPPEEKTAIGQSLRLKTAFSSLKQAVFQADDESVASLFTAGTDYLNARPELTEEETAYLQRLRDLDSFANVYQSTVQYFEGEPDPKSEYSIYLVEPISKSDSQESDSHITFTFRVKGFDEFGNPEAEAREIQFISREDGSFWGFFYKPSTLSPESEYYRNTIRNSLNLALAGAERLAILRLLQDLESQNGLSPAYQVFWQQQLIGFLALSPWKWGLALSPSLQERQDQLAALPSGDVSENLWLSIIEQTVPAPEYALLTEEKFTEKARKEIEALASLYQEAHAGDFLFAGAVQADGSVKQLEGVPEDAPLWTVNALTGRIEPLDDGTGLAPFAPLLHYQLPERSTPAQILSNAESASGLPLSDAPYATLLPPRLDWGVSPKLRPTPRLPDLQQKAFPRP